MSVILSKYINVRSEQGDRRDIIKDVNRKLNLIKNCFPYDIEITGSLSYLDIVSLERGRDSQVIYDFLTLWETTPKAEFKNKNAGGFQTMHKALINSKISKQFSSVGYRRFINILKREIKMVIQYKHKYNVLWYMHYSIGDI